MEYNAIIVAGGRSSRLGGTSKAGLSNGQHTLLTSTIEAVASALCTVVVGPPDLPVPQKVILTRENPPFSGPAAGIAAGLAALPKASARWTLVVGVDMPAVAPALDVLLDAAGQLGPETDGVAGVAGGIFQPLVGVYRTDPLQRVFAGQMANLSVGRVLAGLNYEMCQLPAGSTDDVDTWDSARRLGFTRPTL